MLYVCSVFLIVLNFFKNKSKLLRTLLIVFMFLLMGYSFGNADYSTYEMYFNMYGNSFHYADVFSNNGLFKLLCFIFNNLGACYQDLIVCLSLIGFYNLYTSSKKYIKNCNIIFALYFVYPFIMDITQFRNFVAMTFLVKGCTYLFGNDDERGVLVFAIYNFIACLFHITFVFYYLFILIKYINNKNLKFMLPFVLVLELLMMSNIESIMIFFTSAAKTTFYFSKNINSYTLILLLIFYIFNIYLLAQIQKKYKRIIWISYVFKINLIMILTIPIIYHSFEFMRLWRNIFFLNHMVFAYSIEHSYLKSYSNGSIYINKRCCVFILYILLLFFSLWFFIIFDYYDSVFKPAFEQNIFFY